jgi:branched-chain amino acid transport system ATP-binding protein
VEQNVSKSLKLSNRGYILENGKVTMSGTGEELLADPHTKKAYLGLK